MQTGPVQGDFHADIKYTNGGKLITISETSYYSDIVFNIRHICVCILMPKCHTNFTERSASIRRWTDTIVEKFEVTLSEKSIA